MTKKDYALVAKCVSAMLDKYPVDTHRLQRIAVYNLVGKLVSEFQLDNPKFNKDKFIKACGLKEGK